MLLHHIDDLTDGNNSAFLEFSALKIGLGSPHSVLIVNPERSTRTKHRSVFLATRLSFHGSYSKRARIFQFFGNISNLQPKSDRFCPSRRKSRILICLMPFLVKLILIIFCPVFTPFLLRGTPLPEPRMPVATSIHHVSRKLMIWFVCFLSRSVCANWREPMYRACLCFFCRN